MTSPSASVHVRIAPSPTGYLHVGNVRTALVNWLFARKHGGKFTLRLDDTDQERSRPEFATAIEEDLRWLGLEWHDFFKQSDRYADYEKAKQKLITNGRLYPCFETAEELEVKRKMQTSRGVPPVYDRAALKLSAEEIATRLAKGEKPHYRFKLEDKEIRWTDLVRGECRYHASHISDPVLVREDGVPLYTLASVVDDGDKLVTHVVRGEDHVTNTAVQIQIFEALGYAVPEFAHLALLKTKDGELSKRTGGSDIRGLREAGFEPMAVNALLARMGTSDPIEPVHTLDALVATFDFSKFGRAPANYDAEELLRLNQKLLHHLDFAAAQPRLQTLGLGHITEPFYLAVRGNLHTLKQAAEWWAMAHERVTPHIEDSRFTAAAAELLPPEPWDDTTWQQWTNAVKEKTGRKGKELFMPLRKALTGREDGPELKQLLVLIGREKAAQRLNGETA